jgi:hypothetical protein
MIATGALEERFLAAQTPLGMTYFCGARTLGKPTPASEGGRRKGEDAQAKEVAEKVGRGVFRG